MIRTLAVLLFVSASVATGETHGDSPDAKPSAAADERGMFHLPPGFEIQLVADESQIQKPMNLSFDAAGRLWVTGSALYPWAAQTDALGEIIASWQSQWNSMSGQIGSDKPQPPAAAIDTVSVLSDFGADGRARKVEVFADKLNVPVGIVPLPRAPGAKGDTAIVFSIPNIWRLEDMDGDGKADKREALYTGFGFRDTHGMSSNFLHWMDGWIYGCHGYANHSEVRDRAGRVTLLDSGNTYRFRPDGSAFEIFTHGQTNPFGLTVDPLGRFYSADSHSKPVYFLLPGGFYEGIGKRHDGLGFAPAITHDDHGSSAIAGIAYYSDDKFPEEFRDNVFIGNPVTRTINRDRFTMQGSTPLAVRMPDFLTCDDPWFRPIQVKLGPDGALYIADFYNPIIGHYEQPLLDPRRDHSHGRIWRVVWRGGNHDVPALAGLTSEKRGDPSLVVRTLAVNEIVARGAAGPKGGQDAPSLWVAERTGTLIPERLAAALESDSVVIAVTALRILGDRTDLPAGTAARLRAKLPVAPAVVQLAIVQVLARHPAPENLAPLLAIAQLATDGADIELAYAVRVALREQLGRPGAFPASGSPLSDADRVTLANVALAISTAESATFLLAQLTRWNFDTPRAGEYLSHTARQLPADRLGELATAAASVKGTPQAQQLALADNLTLVARERGIQLSANFQEWVQGVLLTAIGGADEVLQGRAIAALRDSREEAKRAPLLRIIDAADGKHRAAALEALANLPDTGEILARAVLDHRDPIYQHKAATLIAARGDIVLASNALPLVTGDIVPTLAHGLAKSDDGCTALLDLIDRGKVPAAILRQKSLADALNQRNPQLRERAQVLTRDLPPEDARLDGVIASRAAVYKSRKSDAAHGARLFQANCMVCHKFRNEGGNLAPNLDGVTARGPNRLAEDILDPNRNVDGNFRQAVIETTDGRTVAGVNLRESATALILTEAAGKDLSIPRAEVKNQSVSKLSLMPATFESTLAEDELADLMTYLLQP